MSVVVGVDIGGTFTDGVLFDRQTGETYVAKVLTTPSDLSDAFIDTIEELIKQAGVSAADISHVMHASTIATNALLEKKGAAIGLLITEGFRDILEIGRQVRSNLYDIFTEKPPSLVRREFALQIRERITGTGEVLVPLDEDTVRTAAATLRDAGVNSIAICFLHSYRDDRHERRAAEIVREVHPAAALSVSSEIAPEIKEYWRASTSCVNAYVGPVVRRYFDSVSTRLRGLGFTGPVGIMHSGGGVEDLESVTQRPFQMIESGPAAGIAAACYFARELGYPNALSFDMGGTTAKAGLIRDGVNRVLTEFEVAGAGRSGGAVAKASGYAVLGEVVDLVEVGAGGGSIAWIDPAGHLRVGPEGAGADPGPACYGRGGRWPTISDANLVLGRLDEDHFLGGSIRLSMSAALEAIDRGCADELGMSVVEAASGIVEIANATMIEALRLVSVERGHDPQDFCLIAFGGAGPVHACSLAARLGMHTVLILPRPGVASALGLLASEVRHDVRGTHLLVLDRESINGVWPEYERLSERLARRLASEDLATEAPHFTYYLEARYLGQSSRLRVELPEARGDADALVAHLREQFDAAHEQEFGFSVANEPIQIVTLGLAARSPGVTDMHLAFDLPESDPRPTRHKDVYNTISGAFESTPVYARRALRPGQVINGPAIVEEFDSTTVVEANYTLELLPVGVLRLSLRE